jgi:hypothetical protein
LVKEERPADFFSAAFLALLMLSLVLGIPVIIEFSQRPVPRPTAILSMTSCCWPSCRSPAASSWRRHHRTAR